MAAARTRNTPEPVAAAAAAAGSQTCLSGSGNAAAAAPAVPTVLRRSMAAVDTGTGGGIAGIRMAAVQTGPVPGRGSPVPEVAVQSAAPCRRTAMGGRDGPRSHQWLWLRKLDDVGGRRRPPGRAGPAFQSHSPQFIRRRLHSMHLSPPKPISVGLNRLPQTSHRVAGRSSAALRQNGQASLPLAAHAACRAWK
jgi:hypothetical protein